MEPNFCFLEELAFLETEMADRIPLCKYKSVELLQIFKLACLSQTIYNPRPLEIITKEEMGI